jgi:hypothetical protein
MLNSGTNFIGIPTSQTAGPFSTRSKTGFRLAFVLALFVTSLFGTSAKAENFYVSQNGGSFSGGSACSGQSAMSAASFNTATNWSNPKITGKIGPGDTVYLCGTFTGAANGRMLVVQGSGSSGSVITLLFDTGTLFTSPYWLNGGVAPAGAISTNGKSYVLIDGGSTCGWNSALQKKITCNGTIRNTDSGTNLSNKNSTLLLQISNGSTNVEVRNLNLLNAYVRVCCGAEDNDHNNQNAITIGQSGTNNIKIHNNVIDYSGWSIVSGYDNIEIYNNDIGNADHNYAAAPIHAYIHDNHFHDWGIWDDTTGGNRYHHDGFHCFAESTAGAAQALYIYNNLFDGSLGHVGMTGFVFLEGNTSGTRCFVPGAPGSYQFNNVMVSASSSGNMGVIGNASGALQGGGQFNNTLVSFSSTNNTNSGSYFILSNSSLAVNNAFSTMGQFFNSGTSTTYSVPSLLSSILSNPIDHNFGENCTGYTCFSADGNDGSLAGWRAKGHDLHGGYSLSGTGYLKLSSSCVVGMVGVNCAPTSGSPLINAGANLTPLCKGQPIPGMGALCFDITGNPRPSSGAWTVGAYNAPGSTTSAGPIAPPTGLVATVQ